MPARWILAGRGARSFLRADLCGRLPNERRGKSRKVDVEVEKSRVGSPPKVEKSPSKSIKVEVATKRAPAEDLDGRRAGEGEAAALRHDRHQRRRRSAHRNGDQIASSTLRRPSTAATCGLDCAAISPHLTRLRGRPRARSTERVHEIRDPSHRQRDRAVARLAEGASLTPQSSMRSSPR